ncbi:DNA adenine methylase [uncultured Flavonifractor sp.]|nr:DNA adenine methylase [uncultured Flavonifractor sp.]
MVCEKKRPVLKYPGSKWRMADWIISLMPPHKSYLEPFFGSGAVFFNKRPSRIETINDLDGEIVNLFRCVREWPEELACAVALTPYSREEYERAWSRFKAGGKACGIEDARLTLVRYWQSHGSTSVYKGGWKNDRAGREYAYDVRYWRNLPGWVLDAAERLKDAQIEQTQAVELIRRFKHPDVLIYADPPYVVSTRKGKQYVVDMVEDRQHIELLEALKEHPGPVILSGYENELYEKHLQGWMKLHKKALAEGGAARTETVWMNYEPQIEMEMMNDAGD